MDCSPLGSSVGGVLQSRILEWGFPPPGHLPDPGIKSRSSALQADSEPSEPPGKLVIYVVTKTSLIFKSQFLYSYKWSPYFYLMIAAREEDDYTLRFSAKRADCMIMCAALVSLAYNDIQHSSSTSWDSLCAKKRNKGFGTHRDGADVDNFARGV